MAKTVRIVVILAVLVLAGWGLADDGWGPLQGSVGSLTQHPSVRMVSEVVKVVIGKESAGVDCRFVFKNEGKACSVRMCFPDDSSGHFNGEEPASVLDDFRSSVDGKYVGIQYSEHDNGWIKTVRFKRGQTRIVEDHYQAPHDFSDLMTKARTGFIYTLSTGGTWHGTIGRAEIRIDFDRKFHPKPLQVVDANALGVGGAEQLFWEYHPDAVALGSGPCKPKLQGRTLVYIRNNFKPTSADDVQIYFGPLIPAPWLKS